MGCYRLPTNAKHAPVQLGEIHSAGREPWTCAMGCSRHGFKFFGLSMSEEGVINCFCADAFGRQMFVGNDHCGERKVVAVYAHGGGGIEHIGCYKAAGTGGGSELDSEPYRGHSPLTCAHHCGAAGYLYAGMTGGDTCKCGNGYGGGNGPGQCSQRCSMDPWRNCGAESEFSVFGGISTCVRMCVCVCVCVCLCVLVRRV
eukprot:GHVU01110602.1.p2 GENE.GHVU01110602.1~~GHVU01110602.1.p2  ORF type:complete len:200 (+),score=29.37 GHVU01110602.1:194-793(+)